MQCVGAPRRPAPHRVGSAPACSAMPRLARLSATCWRHSSSKLTTLLWCGGGGVDAGGVDGGNG